MCKSVSWRNRIFIRVLSENLQHCVHAVKSHCVHLQPLDGLLAAWAEHDAVMQAGDGSCTAGQGRQRRRGTHPRHGIGHCGEIIPLIHSLAFTVIVLVIG